MPRHQPLGVSFAAWKALATSLVESARVEDKAESVATAAKND